MTVCCPGPPALELQWTPCAAPEPLSAIDGYAGLISRTRGERCPVARLTWTTDLWTHDTHPSIGDRVTAGGQSYFVDSSVYFGCTVILQLCRPVIECPDCTATVFRLGREDQECVDTLQSSVIDAEVPTTICITDQQRRIVDNAEIQLVQARICLDTAATVQVGDLVLCGIDVWRIDRIESPCSSTCLLTLLAIKEPWGIYEDIIPPQPQDYFGAAVLELPTIDFTATGDILSPPEDHTADVALSLPGVQLGGVGQFSAAYDGIADLGLPGIQISGVGEVPPLFLGTADLVLPTAIVAGVGQAIEQLFGEADLSLPTITIGGVGEVVNPPIEYVGSADLDISGAQLAGVGGYIDEYGGTADLVLPGIQITIAGQTKVPDEYDGDATNCPPWETFAGVEFETFAGQQLQFTDECGMTLPSASIGGVGQIAWGYIGSAQLGLPNASVAGVGQSIVNVEYEGTADLSLPTANVAGVGLYTLGAQFLGTSEVCGPWSTDLDSIITDNTGDPIDFGDSCGIGLPGVNVTASGTFFVDNMTSSADFTLPCPRTDGFVDVSPPPPPAQTYEGSASLALSTIDLSATGDYEVPPTAEYVGSATLAISALDMTVTGQFDPPAATVVGMTGGSYVWDGLSMSVTYPLGNDALWQWDTVTGLDPVEALFLTAPLDIAQGADVTSAIFRARVLNAIGFTNMSGTLTAWDTDNAPNVDQNWTPDEVQNLPRTSASTLVVMPTTTSQYEQDLDVTAIVAEIVSRPGWQAGNRIMFLLETNASMSNGSKSIEFAVGLSQTEQLTELIVEVGGFLDVPWTRANYWYFENIESGCSQGSSDPLVTSTATEMILRSQTSCGPNIVRRWALGFAVIGMADTVNEAQVRLSTTALAAGAVPYNTTSVKGYYSLTAFTETTYTNNITRTTLMPAGGLTMPWHWSYGENSYVIGGFGPLLQAMQNDPNYTLGDPFRLLLVPDDKANWDGNVAAPLQGHKVNVNTPVLEYTRSATSETPLLAPSWLDEPEEYIDAKVGIAYDATTFETILNTDNPITVSTTAELNSAVTQARSNSAINAIFLNPGTYTWANELVSGNGGIHRTAAAPLVICTTPGSATQAVVTGLDTGGAIREQSGGMSGIAFVDLDISAGLRLVCLDGMQDILVERCYGNLEIQGERQFGQCIPGSNPCLVLPGIAAKNIVIRLNVLADNWRPDGGLYHGLYGYNIETALIEGNIFDHNGWSDSVGREVADNVGGASGHKHNLYINPGWPAFNAKNIVLRYNITSRASSHGFHCKVGANVYRNLFIKNPIACSNGFGGDQQYNVHGVRQDPVFRDNVAVAGADIDSGNLRGVLIWITCVDNMVCSGNLAIDNGTSSTSNEIHWLERDFPIEVAFDNNRSVNWQSQLPMRGAANFTPVFLSQTGNQFSGLTLNAPAQTRANTLKTDAYLNALKVDRRRLGVDIAQLKADLALLQGGVQ